VIRAVMRVAAANPGGAEHIDRRLGLDAHTLAPAQTVPGADRFLGKPLAPDQVDSARASA
jgi:hypothetical protein